MNNRRKVFIKLIENRCSNFDNTQVLKLTILQARNATVYITTLKSPGL